MIYKDRKLAQRPIIGITMGDAAGIGPEIIVKTLSCAAVYMQCLPVVLGDAGVIKFYVRRGRFQHRVNIIKDFKEAAFKYRVIDVLDIKNIDLAALKIGKIQKMCGRASVEYVKKGVELALKKEICAVKRQYIRQGFLLPGIQNYLLLRRAVKDMQ